MMNLLIKIATIVKVYSQIVNGKWKKIKEHETKVPEPPSTIYTAPPCNWYFNILIKFMRGVYAYVIEQNQKSFSYFMDRTKHNMNFSKANDRNNTNAINKFTTLNLKVNIFMRTYFLQIPIHHTVFW